LQETHVQSRGEKGFEEREAVELAVVEEVVVVVVVAVVVVVLRKASVQADLPPGGAVAAELEAVAELETVAESSLSESVRLMT
jgi:hypothetical protein